MKSIAENKALRQLLWIGMGAIGMFFAGLTSAYIVRKAEGNWLDFVLPDWFLYSTIIIIISSFFFVLARKNINNQHICSNLVLVVLILGLFFSYFQLNGWKELTSQGVFLTGLGSNVAGSFLYVITLSHLIHLIGGLVAILFVVFRTRKGLYTDGNYLGFDLAYWYWHFLGILWIYLFFFLKYA
tara:strand:+ start:658 stop:1209 length:552 start_codon:yes stop_codon:yes gene_type:complete